MEEKIYASELAGHCNELTAWQILKEVSEPLIRMGLRSIDPYCIEIGDDGHFLLDSKPKLDKHCSFDAPEVAANQITETGVVWSLGASLFFVVLGCQVMNGKGSKGQQESSKLPYMRSEWPEMSELVQQCLHFSPARRPSFQQIHDKALQQHQRCMDEIKKGPKFKNTGKASPTGTDFGQELAFWPEAMQSSIV